MTEENFATYEQYQARENLPPLEEAARLYSQSKGELQKLRWGLTAGLSFHEEPNATHPEEAVHSVLSLTLEQEEKEWALEEFFTYWKPCMTMNWEDYEPSLAEVVETARSMRDAFIKRATVALRLGELARELLPEETLE